MARKGQGPRQPLSQRRPKAATKRGALIPAKGGRGAPPASKIRANGTKTIIPATRKAVARRKIAKKIKAADLRSHAAAVYSGLLALYPDAHCELNHQNAWQLLVATILSAQTTDRRVNMVTPALFAKFPTPADLAAARQENLEEIIRSTGFFRSKSRNLIAMAGAVVDRHDGQVPPSLDDLVKLPGVGRKTANVVLGNACNISVGVVVDTHVQRLSNRLGLTTETDPEKIERVLMDLFPRENWTMLSHLLIWHGRRVCDARKPKCSECALSTICPSAFVA
jgi:endonuclease-3